MHKNKKYKNSKLFENDLSNITVFRLPLKQDYKFVYNTKTEYLKLVKLLSIDIKKRYESKNAISFSTTKKH